MNAKAIQADGSPPGGSSSSCSKHPCWCLRVITQLDSISDPSLKAFNEGLANQLTIASLVSHHSVATALEVVGEPQDLALDGDASAADDV